MTVAPKQENTTLSLDEIRLGVPEVREGLEFYKDAFSVTAANQGDGTTFDMHGTGRFALYETEALAQDAHVQAPTSGFRGYTLNVIVGQPGEVKALLDVAVQNGANVLKPAKKWLFGGFSAVYEAPDGAIWKLAASTKKDTGPVGVPPIPTEPTVIIIGVADLKTSKEFYTALGMTVDRDYGNQYVDFQPGSGTCRLGLMQRKTLAKDANVHANGSGFRSVAFGHVVTSRDEVDGLLSAAVFAGGQTAVTARESTGNTYAGYFVDPDGFLWHVSTKDLSKEDNQ